MSPKAKRTLSLIFAAGAAAALFGGLVHGVLVAAHVSEPAATTVYGPTPRRLWAGTVAALALAGVVIGARSVARPASRLAAIAALSAGLIGSVNGGLVLALADGGPGSGNGVVGAAGALVLGLVGLGLGGVALSRSRAASEPD